MFFDHYFLSDIALNNNCIVSQYTKIIVNGRRYLQIKILQKI